jgi:hypothetical protein
LEKSSSSKVKIILSVLIQMDLKDLIQAAQGKNSQGEVVYEQGLTGVALILTYGSRVDNSCTQLDWTKQSTNKSSSLYELERAAAQDVFERAVDLTGNFSRAFTGKLISYVESLESNYSNYIQYIEDKIAFYNLIQLNE